MRNKKLVSTVVASALVATTMAMPVMAAGESGSVDVDVSTKTGVLRVQVPTKMAMQIDQFEIGQEGSQIACVDEFDMTNLSEMNVKVAVKSSVDIDTAIKLAPSVEAVEASEDAEAWLAVAAKTNDGSTNSNKVYDDLETGDATTPKVEEYWELTEANSNVTTFADDKTAEQTFYLEKATGNTTYKLAIPDTNGKVGEAYAQFYALTEVTGLSDDASLQTAVDADDIYVVADNPSGTPAAPAKDGDTMTKLNKGDTVTTGAYAATNKYYKAADTASTPADGTRYMYPALATAGGKAGFRYVGKLSDANEKTWTETDIKGISIAYTITGITASNYTDVVDDCTYGLYAAVKGPQVSITENGLITVSNLTAENNFKSLTITDKTGKVMEWNIAPAEWNTDNWDATNGGTFTVQLGEQWISYLISQGGTAEVTVTLKDNSTIKSGIVTVTQ